MPSVDVNMDHGGVSLHTKVHIYTKTHIYT